MRDHPLSDSLGSSNTSISKSGAKMRLLASVVNDDHLETLALFRLDSKIWGTKSDHPMGMK